MLKRLLLISFLTVTITAQTVFAQDDYQIRTLFNTSKHRASGGYAALTNKFTTIRGDYANMVELYGGWYINHSFLLGVSGAAVTNNIPVPYDFSVNQTAP